MSTFSGDILRELAEGEAPLYSIYCWVRARRASVALGTFLATVDVLLAEDRVLLSRTDPRTGAYFFSPFQRSWRSVTTKSKT